MICEYCLPLLAIQDVMKLTAGLNTSGCSGDAPPIRLSAAGRSWEHTHWFISNEGCMYGDIGLNFWLMEITCKFLTNTIVTHYTMI